jgi:hypothetical protein
MSLNNGHYVGIWFTSGLELRTPLDIPTSTRHMLQLYLLVKTKSWIKWIEVFHPHCTNWPTPTPRYSICHLSLNSFSIPIYKLYAKDCDNLRGYLFIFPYQFTPIVWGVCPTTIALAPTACSVSSRMELTWTLYY